MTPEDHVIVLFGATGDLARRKLLPGLFRLAEAGLMPERYRIVATSRAPLDTDGFRQFAKAAVEVGAPAHVLTASLYDRFASRGESQYADKLLSAMRSQFAGHAEKVAA